MSTQNTNTDSFRASGPFQTIKQQLGPLVEMPGTWVGRGFNMIWLPVAPGDRQNPKIVRQNGDDFRLKLNAVHERLTFSNTGMIPNRGHDQPDITFFGLSYLQEINDAETDETLHIETGMWLNLPKDNKDPSSSPWKWSVARMATIPHGDALFAQGPYRHNPTRLEPNKGPFLGFIPDPTPFSLDGTGKRTNTTSPAILDELNGASAPAGINPKAVLNPNQVLIDALDTQKSTPNDQNVIETIVMAISANPVGNIDLTQPAKDDDAHRAQNAKSDGTPAVPPNPNIPGSITNIPFVDRNANADSFAAIFWIETVQNPDGSCFMQLQYTQTVILDFGGLKWPHISVATLVKR